MSFEFEPDRNRSGNKKKWSKRVIGICSGLAIGVTGVIAYQNSTKVDEAVAALEQLSKERNTCELRQVLTSRDAAGEVAVEVVVAVTEKTRPDIADGQFDGLLMDTQFSDGPGNLNNGIVLEWPNERRALSIDSGPPSGPFNTGNFMRPTIPPYDESRRWVDGVYTIYRQNAVQLSSDGLLIKDAIETGVGSVKCGQFVMKDQAVWAVLGSNGQFQQS